MNDRTILNTWKEIASYLRKGVRTVQRLEHYAGLPVRRVDSNRRCVFAFADEIDRWLENARVGIDEEGYRLGVPVLDLDEGLATICTCVIKHWTQAVAENKDRRVNLALALQVKTRRVAPAPPPQQPREVA